MHCTGHTSTQARSFTSMHASVMIARPAMGQILCVWSDRPLHDRRRVGQVDTVCAGADGAVEVRPHRRVELTDSDYCLADRSGDAGACALGCGGGSPIAT